VDQANCIPINIFIIPGSFEQTVGCSKIRQRKIANYISNKDAAKEILETAKISKKKSQGDNPQFRADDTINMDQTGCQYQSTIGMTLG